MREIDQQRSEQALRQAQPTPLRKPNVDQDVTGGIQTRGLSDTLRRCQAFRNRTRTNNEWLLRCSELHGQEQTRNAAFAREIREETGLSLREVARRMGISGPGNGAAVARGFYAPTPEATRHDAGTGRRGDVKGNIGRKAREGSRPAAADGRGLSETGRRPFRVAHPRCAPRPPRSAGRRAADKTRRRAHCRAGPRRRRVRVPGPAGRSARL